MTPLVRAHERWAIKINIDRLGNQYYMNDIWHIISIRYELLCTIIYCWILSDYKVDWSYRYDSLLADIVLEIIYFIKKEDISSLENPKNHAFIKSGLCIGTSYTRHLTFFHKYFCIIFIFKIRNLAWRDNISSCANCIYDTYIARENFAF